MPTPIEDFIRKSNHTKTEKARLKQTLIDKKAPIPDDRLLTLANAVLNIPIQKQSVKLNSIEEYKIIQDKAYEQSTSTYPNLLHTTSLEVPAGEWVVMLIGNGGKGGGGHKDFSGGNNCGGGGGGAGYITMEYFNAPLHISNVVIGDNQVSAIINGKSYTAKTGDVGGTPNYDGARGDGGNGSSGGGGGGRSRKGGTGYFNGNGGNESSAGGSRPKDATGATNSGGPRVPPIPPGYDRVYAGAGGGGAGYGAGATGGTAGHGLRAEDYGTHDYFDRVYGGGGGAGYRGHGAEGGCWALHKGGTYGHTAEPATGFGSGGGGSAYANMGPHSYDGMTGSSGGRPTHGAVIIFKVLDKTIL